MNKGKYAASMVLFVLLASDPVAAQDEPGDCQETYVNPVHGWSISYPDGWQIDSTDRDGVVIRTPRGLSAGAVGGVGIHALPASWGGSLEDIAGTAVREWGLALQARGQTFQTTSRRRITLPNGLDAMEFVHRIGTGFVGRSRKLVVAPLDRAFLLDAESAETAWSTFEAQFAQIVNSFAIDRRPGSTTDARPLLGLPEPTRQPSAQATPQGAPLPRRQERMEEARRAASAGREYITILNTDSPDTSGVFVFFNNPAPLCYTYMIPGRWKFSDGAFRSRDGVAAAKVRLVPEDRIPPIKGASLVERMRTSIHGRPGQPPGCAELIPFWRPGWWKCAPASPDQSMVIVDLGPSAAGWIVVAGTEDDDGLIEGILRTLRTTADPHCYWQILEDLLKIQYPEP